jgi:hypothetical protein
MTCKGKGARKFAPVTRRPRRPARTVEDRPNRTRTPLEYDGKRFIVRSAPRPAASLALRAAGVAPPLRDATASRTLAQSKM